MFDGSISILFFQLLDSCVFLDEGKSLLDHDNGLLLLFAFGRTKHVVSLNYDQPVSEIRSPFSERDQLWTILLEQPLHSQIYFGLDVDEAEILSHQFLVLKNNVLLSCLSF